MTEPVVRRALVSVWDKTGLDVLAQAFLRHGIEVLATGQTAKTLQAMGARVTEVSAYTGFPEILDGRVKTLHPKIAAGILARPTADDMAVLQAHDMAPIDLVVVNLYPFEDVVARPEASMHDAIEHIDIGGPTLLRAAAKNWHRVASVVHPKDYVHVVAELDAHGGVLTERTRKRLAAATFAQTARYDAAIARYWAEHSDTLDDAGLPERLQVDAPTQSMLRYGENPHQEARLYGSLDAHAVRVLQGKALSFNNWVDVDAAAAACADLAGLGTAAVVVKHASPCGAAVAKHGALVDVVRRARVADAESAFGGIVALNRELDAATAQVLVETFLEVVVATSVAPFAREILARKTNLRVLETDAVAEPSHGLRVRSTLFGWLAQTEDALDDPFLGALHGVVPDELQFDVAWAWRLVKHARSNGIVLVRDGVSLAIAGGQTSRVEAVRQALARAGDAARGAVLASDGFFPFADSVELAAKHGVAVIVQPGGSMRDADVIAAAQARGVPMLLTGRRHFRH